MRTRTDYTGGRGPPGRDEDPPSEQIELPTFPSPTIVPFPWINMYELCLAFYSPRDRYCVRVKWVGKVSSGKSILLIKLCSWQKCDWKKNVISKIVQLVSRMCSLLFVVGRKTFMYVNFESWVAHLWIYFEMIRFQDKLPIYFTIMFNFCAVKMSRDGRKIKFNWNGIDIERLRCEFECCDAL